MIRLKKATAAADHGNMRSPVDIAELAQRLVEKTEVRRRRRDIGELQVVRHVLGPRELRQVRVEWRRVGEGTCSDEERVDRVRRVETDDLQSEVVVTLGRRLAQSAIDLLGRAPTMSVDHDFSSHE